MVEDIIKKLLSFRDTNPHPYSYPMRPKNKKQKPEEIGPFGERWVTVSINGKSRRVRLRNKTAWEKELERALGRNKW